jgi:radical SAM protein (TIGR01212 family)
MQPTPFYTYRQYLLDTYGHRVYRVPINLGWGCPHRKDDGSGGCSFCPADGAHSVQTPKTDDIREQIQAGISFARDRYHVEHFMAYIQAYTGTYADPKEQERQYRKILEAYPFESMSIGTRPDCLSPQTLELLTTLKEKVDVIVELGIQTMHDDLLQRINRGHNWATSLEAIQRLHHAGIRVFPHVILGLPGSNEAMDRETAITLSRLPLDGVKIHNLHVIRKTPLAEEYTAKPFPVLDEVEYADRLIDFIRHLPPTMAIGRIKTDTPAEELIAPKWHLKKGSFLHLIQTRMQNENLKQGDLFQQ